MGLLLNTLLNEKFEVPADGWCHAMALGDFPNTLTSENPDGKVRRRRVMQVCDKAAATAIVAAFNRAAVAPDFPGLLIDRDHESDHPDKTTDAWGWCYAMENRADGIWVKARWTDLGEPAVRNGRFRFLSPVFDPAECEDLGNNRLRPTRVVKLALTNDPNIRPLKPLSNRAPAPADSGTERKESTMDYKAELLGILELKADATDEAISAGCAGTKAALANRATLEAESATLESRAETAEAGLARLERAKLEADVEQDLEKFKDRIANRDEVRLALLANRDGTLKILAAMAPIAANAEPLRNRADAKAPDAAKGAAEKMALVNRRVGEIQAARKCGFEEAWNAVKAEAPELFET